MKPLVLASSSPIRAKMLADAGVATVSRPTSLDEDAAKHALAERGANACEMATGLAVAKAQATRAGDDELVLGADQTLDLDGQVFDKPGDLARLKQQLTRLQGRSHALHSAAALVRGGDVLWSGLSSVRLVMRPLGLAELDEYIEREGPHVLGCVGGYRLEGPGVQLFDAVDGEYFAVLGLPLLGVLKALRAVVIHDRQG